MKVKLKFPYHTKRKIVEADVNKLSIYFKTTNLHGIDFVSDVCVSLGGTLHHGVEAITISTEEAEG